jgi:hypothetical protein
MAAENVSRMLKSLAEFLPVYPDSADLVGVHAAAAVACHMGSGLVRQQEVRARLQHVPVHLAFLAASVVAELSEAELAAAAVDWPHLSRAWLLTHLLDVLAYKRADTRTVTVRHWDSMRNLIQHVHEHTPLRHPASFDEADAVVFRYYKIK